jgi:CubicO group peptidase (beta-lactamase class C family)
MKYAVFVAFLFSALLCEKAFSQVNTESNPIAETIQKNGERFLKNRNIKSVSIGIYKDKQVYTGHFGEIQKANGVLPDDQTIYEVGSVTKTITGYLVAKAVLEGKINLSDDIRTYLKGDYSNLEYKGKPIRIEHLLTHTSGLPMFLPLQMNEVFEKMNESVPEKYLELEKSYNKEKFLKDLKKVSITTAPGTYSSYSNTGAELLGYVLETVYNKSIDELIKEIFSDAYGMSTTGIELDSIQKEKLVRGYWMDNEALSPNQFNSLWGTAGGVKMDMMDMMRYAQLQLDTNNPIVSQSHKVLYEESNASKMGYFWRAWSDKYGTSYNHHGGTSGTQNWLFIYPKYNLGISIITNQSGPKTPKLLSKTAQRILKEVIKD